MMMVVQNPHVDLTIGRGMMKKLLVLKDELDILGNLMQNFLQHFDTWI